MKRWISAAAVLLGIASSACAQTSIVDVEYVKAAVSRGVLLWDARDADDFSAGHIPGAVNIGDPTITLRDKNTEDYLPIGQIEKAFGAVGIDPGREIIVYGDRGLPSAYFAQVTLRFFGATSAKVFHDGIEGWRAAGQPVTTAPTKARPIAVKLVPMPGVISESKEVVAALKRPDVQFLDVRTAREYRGEDVRAIRGGHIPGAINIPFEQNWVDPETRNKLRSGAVKDSSGMSLKPREQLLKLYEKLDPNREIHVYCQSSNRASQTAVVLMDLGFRNVKVYDSSWLGYSSWLTAPAEDEIWTNFGSLPAAMRAIENRFGELEKQRVAR
jgi:thiosulfate/3-mercaptopyruvate sulfurtransferase